MKSICFGILALIAIAGAQTGPDDKPKPSGKVYLFRGKDMQGKSEAITVRGGYCVNFKDAWNDKVGSIDMQHDTCIMAHEDQNCRGDVVRLEQGDLGTGDLSQIRWKDRISSLSLC